MRNYRFRFSDMIPNAWFYKLKDMSRHHHHHHNHRNSQKTLNPTKQKHSPASSSLSSSSASSSLSSSSVAVAVVATNHASSEITKQPHVSDQRKSYYFTRDLTFQPIKTRISDKELPVEPPRKSSRRRRSTKRNRRPPLPPPQPRLVSASISAGCSCGATLESVWAKPPDSSPEDSSLSSSSEHDSMLTEYGSDRDQTTPELFDSKVSWSSSCKCRAENNDIIIDMNNDNDGHDNKAFSGLDHLPPIITKKHEPTKIQRTSAEFSETNKYGSLSVKVVKEKFLTTTAAAAATAATATTSPVRRFSVNSSSPGVRLRTNSPRIANLRIQGRKSVSSNSSSGGSRRSVSESFAVVKSSKNPRRDFRESMVEMIVENNIRASKDLEELLACYLSLNSDEYHDLIINVFKQIWFDFVHLRLK